MERGPTYDAKTDYLLMSGFSRGRVRAAEAMFLRFAPLVFGIGMQAFNDADRASELVEETFVRLWRRSHLFTISSPPLEAWVLIHALGVVLRMSRFPVAIPDAADTEPAGAVYAVSAQA
jgi:DNA-directed RNA polymerase specialized sigma24 family protein